jgi:hypothetical protein
MDFLQSGRGATVVALAPVAFAGGAGCAALAQRFRVVTLADATASEAAAWIAGEGLESVGVLALGDRAPTAFELAEAAAQVSALVLVSPQGLLSDDEAARVRLRAVAAPKCVLVGGADASQPANALARYRTELGAAGVVLVYDAGADIAADRPAAFASAAGDFLERQARFGLATGSMALMD